MKLIHCFYPVIQLNIVYYFVKIITGDISGVYRIKSCE